MLSDDDLSAFRIGAGGNDEVTKLDARWAEATTDSLANGYQRSAGEGRHP